MDALLAVLWIFGSALLGGFVFLILSGIIAALFVMLLWNGVLVGLIPGISEIGFLSAWGLYILAGLLFKTSYHPSGKNS